MSGTVVGHDTLDGYTHALVVGDGGFEEEYGTGLVLGLHELAEGTREASSMRTLGFAQGRRVGTRTGLFLQLTC